MALHGISAETHSRVFEYNTAFSGFNLNE